MATRVSSYKVGLGADGTGVISQKTTFKYDDKIYAQVNYSETDVPGESEIKWYRKEGSSWKRKYTSPLRNILYPAGFWHWSWIKNFPAGDWKVEFVYNNSLHGLKYFTINTKPDDEPTPDPINETIVNVIVVDIPTNTRHAQIKVELMGKTQTTDFQGFTKFVFSDGWSGTKTETIKLSGNNFESQSNGINLIFPKEYTVAFGLDPIIDLPEPEPTQPEETVQFWVDKGFSTSDATKTAQWVKDNKMSPSQATINFILSTDDLIKDFPYDVRINLDLATKDMGESERWAFIANLSTLTSAQQQKLIGDIINKDYSWLDSFKDAAFATLATVGWPLAVSSGAFTWLAGQAAISIATLQAAFAKLISVLGIDKALEWWSKLSLNTKGSKATTNAIVKYVLEHTESAARSLAKMPKPLRESVISKLYSTSAGRVAIVNLHKAGYFKYLAPAWKTVLTKAGASVGVASLLIGIIGSYPFAGFIKEEALQTLGFAANTARQNKDISGLRTALDKTKELLNPQLWDKIYAAIPFANVVAMLKSFYNAAQTKLDIDEAGFEDLKDQWGESTIEHEQFKITATPSDAKITVEGQFPASGVFSELLPVGDYDVTITAFGYEPQSKTLTLSVGNPIDRRFSLEKPEDTDPDPDPEPEITGSLSIGSSPSGAKIYIDDDYTFEITRTTIKLPVGEYKLTLKKKDYHDRSIQVTVKANVTKGLTYKLTSVDEPDPDPDPIPPPDPDPDPDPIPPIPDPDPDPIPPDPEPETGTLIVKSSPSASVYHLGRRVGSASTSNPFESDYAPGTYQFELRKSGYLTKTFSAYIRKDRTTRKSYTLSKISEPEPPVIDYALVKITSEPSGANIYVNGEYKYMTTPATMRFTEGVHLIHLEVQGYYPLEYELEVTK